MMKALGGMHAQPRRAATHHHCIGAGHPGPTAQLYLLCNIVHSGKVGQEGDVEAARPVS